jgi:DNA polymerase-3 subunit delta'
VTFHGNRSVVETLERMIGTCRVAQTILLHGPEGVGKATLARWFAARLLGHGADKIELDDLSRPDNTAVIADREKLPSEKRNEDPLLFASHPDFVTFPPDGPLRQLSIPQMRLLKERAAFKPLQGAWRVFLIDRIDRANEQAANSLLKTLEEPPAHLVLIMTAENPYDLLPTIRSRAVHFPLVPLDEAEMRGFLASREQLENAARRVALSGGCPGRAVSIDLEAYDKRRAAMLALLKVASKQAAFSTWVKYSESISASKTEKLDAYLEVLYVLLEDVLLLSQGLNGRVRNPDLERDLTPISGAVTFGWIRRAVSKTDDLMQLTRRNIQKSIALDAFALELQAGA